jgi:release factor glutamine methyltransferase
MPFDPGQVYQPEADTFLLLEAARAELNPGDRVLEIGTGSGFIAAELSRTARVVATDINPHAIASAREMGLDVVRTDLFSGICGKFDLVIFNPPYLPTQPGERLDDWLEYALDGGETGRVVIERFAAEVKGVLAPGGRILLLVSSLTGLEEVRNLFSHQGFSTTVAIQQRVEDEMLYIIRITGCK